MDRKKKSYCVSETGDELGLSDPTILKLVRTGELDAFRTPGGHFRITAESIDRFRRGPNNKTEQSSSPVLRSTRDSVGEIVAETELLKARRTLRKEQEEDARESARARQEVLRQERERTPREENERLEQGRLRAEQEEQIQSRQQALLRQQWTDGWIKRAVASIPRNCPEEYHGLIYTEVEIALEDIPQSRPDYIITKIVAGACQRALRPWLIQKAIEDAEKTLPYNARSSYSPDPPSTWQLRYLEIARRNIAKLGEDASVQEVSDIAIMAAREVTSDYQKAEAETERQRRAAHEREISEMARTVNKALMDMKIKSGLDYVGPYLRQVEEREEWDWDVDGDLFKTTKAREEFTNKIQRRIQGNLAAAIQGAPGMDNEKIRKAVANLVSRVLPEFVEE